MELIDILNLGGTLKGPSSMVVYGPKLQNVTILERLEHTLLGAQWCLFAQTRDKLMTTTGPISNWSGYQTWFYWEHGYTPVFQIKEHKLAGEGPLLEYFKNHNDWHNAFFKTPMFACVVGLILIMKEIYSSGWVTEQRVKTALSDEVEIVKMFARNEATIGWVPQRRWMESAGFPDDSEQPFDAS